MVSPLAAIAIERKTFEDRLAYQAQHDPLTGLPNRVLFVEFLTLALAAGIAPPDDVGRALPRPGPLQDRQRQPRPRRRRRAHAQAQRRACATQSGRATPLPASAATSSRCSATTSRPNDARAPGDRRRATAARGHRGPGPAERRGPAPEREHRHRDGRPRRQPGDAAARRRRRDVPGQGRRQGALGSCSTSRCGRPRGSGSRPRTRCTARSSATSCASSTSRSSSWRPARCAGAEALVRWQHPDRGLVAPDAFIDLAEETGLIVPLGAWVLEEACRQLMEWRESGVVSPTFSMAVNLSARQLAQPDLVAQVAAALERTGAPPERVCLEITESVLMAETTIEAIDALRALGVRLSIDDFGTGYSSLGLPAPVPGRLGQGRPVVRGRARDRVRGLGDRRRGREPRPRARAERRRRRSGDRAISSRSSARSVATVRRASSSRRRSRPTCSRRSCTDPGGSPWPRTVRPRARSATPSPFPARA